MEKWFKINERNLLASSIDVQYRIQGISPYIPGHLNFNRICDITVEVKKSNKSDYDFIIDLYEKDNQIDKFDFTSAYLLAGGCSLGSINISSNSLKFEIISDYIKTKSLVKKRDEVIDSILKKD